MKKILIIIGIGIMLLTSCSVNTSSNIDFDGNDVKYVQDTRTGLCFAVIASRKSGSAATTGLGFTECDCEKVKHLIGA